MSDERRFKNRYLLLFYLAIIGGWQLLSTFGEIPDYILPAPHQVVRRLAELSADNLLAPSLMSTLKRMVQAFSLSVLAGALFGLGMGGSVVLDGCLKSLFLGLLTLPTAAWAPLALIIFGLNDRAIYFVIFMSSVPAMAIATSDAIHRIPVIYIRAAQTLGTPAYLMPTRVIIPAALPQILTGIKLGWTLGWHGAVSAELIKSSVGLGFLLHMGREMNDASQVLAVMLTTIIVGIFFDRLIFYPIERRLRIRWGLQKSH